MRFLILFICLFLNNCLNVKSKQIIFPSLYVSCSTDTRSMDQNIKLEELDGKCLNEDLVLLFQETNEAICTLYVNGKEVKKGHILKDGYHEVKLQMYKNGLIKTKSIFFKIDKEIKNEKFGRES